MNRSRGPVLALGSEVELVVVFRFLPALRELLQFQQLFLDTDDLIVLNGLLDLVFLLLLFALLRHVLLDLHLVQLTLLQIFLRTFERTFQAGLSTGNRWFSLFKRFATYARLDLTSAEFLVFQAVLGCNNVGPLHVAFLPNFLVDFILKFIQLLNAGLTLSTAKAGLVSRLL